MSRDNPVEAAIYDWFAGFIALRRVVESAQRTQMIWGAAVLLAVLIPLAFNVYGHVFGG